MRKAFGLSVLAALLVVGAVFAHVESDPELLRSDTLRVEGQTLSYSEGFAKRAGSSYGQRAVKGVVEFSVATVWTHEDLRYRPSDLHGAWPRTRYAVFRTFWVPRDDSRRNTFAAGRVSGAFVAGQVAPNGSLGGAGRSVKVKASPSHSK